MPEVEDIAQAELCDFEVIHHLPNFPVGNFGDDFGIDHNRIKRDYVRDNHPDSFVLITKVNVPLLITGYPPKAEFNHRCVFIGFFMKSTAHLI